MKRFLQSIFVLVAVFACRVPFTPAFGQPPTREELTAGSALERARLSLAAISSIEYEFRSEQIGPGKQSNRSKRLEIGRFAYANDNFRSQYSIDSEDYRASGIAAYDGKGYQHKADDQPRISIQADYPVPYRIIQPIMFPFATFLGNPTIKHRFDLEAFRGPDLWNSAKDAAMFVERREVDGHPCAVVQIERKPPFRPTKRELCLALDLDCYPILITFTGEEDRSRSGTLRVADFADVKTSRGRVIVPIRIEVESHDATNTIQSSIVVTVDKQTLKVNEPIDAKLFDLSQ